MPSTDCPKGGKHVWCTTDFTPPGLFWCIQCEQFGDERIVFAGMGETLLIPKLRHWFDVVDANQPGVKVPDEVIFREGFER